MIKSQSSRSIFPINAKLSASFFFTFCSIHPRIVSLKYPLSANEQFGFRSIKDAFHISLSSVVLTCVNIFPQSVDVSCICRCFDLCLSRAVSSVPKNISVSHKKKSPKLICLVVLYPIMRFFFGQVKHFYGTLAGTVFFGTPDILIYMTDLPRCLIGNHDRTEFRTKFGI